MLQKPFPPSQDQTLITPGDTLSVPALRSSPYLVVLFPTELYRSIPLPQGPVLVGRGPECPVCIPDPQVSRRHCEITWDGATIRVRDLNSTNGTSVDGSPVKDSCELRPDSRLMLGPVVLKVEFKNPDEVERERALFEAATTDALTKIPNRRFFLERAHAVFSAARRSNRWIHAILTDVDHFKKVNDTWGHPAGDFVLREVAAILNRERREEDLLARFGGEEFIFLLSEIDARQCIALAERLRKAIENHRFIWNDARIPVTISLGVASRTAASVEHLDALFAEADARLYQAKQSGRNQVCAE